MPRAWPRGTFELGSARRGIAVEYAAELIAYLKGMARRIQKEGPFDDLYDINHTTVHTGTVQGGTALNIVPKDCSFEFEFRCIAGHDGRALYEEVVRHAREVLEPEMKAIDPSTGFTFEELSAIEGLDIDPGEEVVTLAKTLAGGNDHAKVAFGTEAGLFQQDADPNGGLVPGWYRSSAQTERVCRL